MAFHFFFFYDDVFVATMLESLPAPRPVALAEMFADAPAEALDLLRCCLQFNPERRITADAALRHPFVADFVNTEDEPTAPGPIVLNVDDNTKCEP
jgi:mitogen-activated protein kinase 15